MFDTGILKDYIYPYVMMHDILARREMEVNCSGKSWIRRSFNPLGRESFDLFFLSLDGRG